MGAEVDAGGAPGPVDKGGEGVPWCEAGRAVPPSDDDDAGGAAVGGKWCGSVVVLEVSASAAFSSSDNIVLATFVMSFISEISPICVCF